MASYEARRAGFFEFFLNYLFPIRNRGAPSGVAVFIVPDDYLDNISISKLNTAIFMGNNLFFTNILRGFTTITVSAPKMRYS